MGPKSSISTKVAVIVITAVLYALAKGITGYVPSPWGVGQLFIGGFIIAFMAVIAEPLPVAVGAGMGTFIGDMLFLVPAGSTNAPLSLAAGVPGNFIATLLFALFVKRYTSWRAFVAASVSILTFGNLLTASLVALTVVSLFPALGSYLSVHVGLGVGLVFGLTVFWSVTTIPVTIIVVPLLIKAVAPLKGRSAIVRDVPSWTTQGAWAPLIATLFLSLGTFLVVLLYLPGAFGLAAYPALTVELALATIGLIIVLPVAGVVIGRESRTVAKLA